MPFDFALLADNASINQWLNDNPVGAGLIYLALGGALAGWGAYEWSRGVAFGKWGVKVEGPMAYAFAILKIVVGLLFCAFALYKIFVG